MTEKSKISSLFYSGNHRAVIENTLDVEPSNYSPSEFCFVVGALVYLGRLDEAERLYMMKYQLLETKDLIKCRYFLGLGFCRHSFYSKSRKYFVENFGQRRLSLDGQSQFFIFQGLGFYHYFAGRMTKALKNAEKALSAALSENYLYGRTLSMDLKGHTLIQTGQVGPGLQTLNLAEKLAVQLGASWLSEAIRVSLVSYRARFGIDSHTTVKTISTKLKELSKQDVYLQSTLLLDLAQEYFRRGRLSEGKDALNECCRCVYASENRRHAALLNLRYAYVQYLEGDSHLALNLIRNALTQIAPEVDVLLELKLRGFEERIVRELQIKECTQILAQKIEHLTKKVGESGAQRILRRQKKVPFTSDRLGEDPYGDLVDKAHREPLLAVDSILESGFLGLLVDALLIPRGKRVLYLDLQPGSFTIFEKGNIDHLPDTISKSLRSLLLELYKGKRTKEELIKSIWGYEYHPLRHDALIYSAIAKLRKALGSRSHWLEVSDSGYQLRPDVMVMAGKETSVSHEKVNSFEIFHERGPTLNLRQQKILRFLDQNESIDTMTCTSLFETSEITASRDLSELLKLQLIVRVGKGRATKYTRGLDGKLNYGIDTTNNGGDYHEVN